MEKIAPSLKNKVLLKKIRKERENKDFSQDYLAEKLGITQKAYSKIETGETNLSLERIKIITEILEMDLIELLSNDEKIIVDSITNNKSVNFGNNSVTNHNSDLTERESEVSGKRTHQLEDEILFLRNEILFLRKITGAFLLILLLYALFFAFNHYFV